MNNTNNLVYDCYYLINLFEVYEKPLSNWMLYNLIYLYEAYYMNKYNANKLYDYEYEAWCLGPVIKFLLKTFPEHRNGLKLNDSQKVELSYVTSNYISNKRKETLIEIFNLFGNYTPVELARIIRDKDSPWHKAYRYKEYSIIPKKAIKKWFKQNLS